MPSVHTFWQLPEDEEPLLERLEKFGELYALPNDWRKDPLTLTPRPIREFLAENNPTQLLMLAGHQLGSVVVEEQDFEGQQLFGVTAMRSCVIAYSRAQFLGELLVLSNLAAYWDYLSEDESEILPKAPEFIEWGKKVFASARRFTAVKLDDYRATKRVSEAVARGEIELKG